MVVISGFRKPLLAALTGALLLAGCHSSSAGSGGDAPPPSTPDASEAPPPPKAIVDLRVDANRDGRVSLDDDSDDVGEDVWDATHGAVFLANIDDDRKTCKPVDGRGQVLSDIELPKCNDAADEVVNGDDDILDLAPIKTVPWKDAPDDAQGTLAVKANGSGVVRLFRRDASGAFSVVKGAQVFNAGDIRTGLDLYIEAKDIVRDPAKWDGRVELTWHVTATLSDGNRTDESDKVVMRVSPVMLFPQTQNVETVSVSRLPRDSDSTAFVNELQSNTGASGVKNPLLQISTDDPWNQDYFEPGWMAMPGPNGPHVIRVNLRSANIFYDDPDYPLREAGASVFTDLRGPDSAGVQQFDVSSDPNMDSLNSFGNTETIPPYELGDKKYPLGRIIRGSIPSFHPDASFARMLESQGMQPPVYIDTSWLLVGHVDETLSFLKANTPRGWILLVNDAALAKKMLEDQVTAGNGSVPMFVGMKWVDDRGREYSAQATISQVLADTDVMATSADAIARVDAQIDVIKKETGLTDAEIVRIPFLHHSVDGGSIAYQPGTVNQLVPNDTNLIVPEPHGPTINGVDIFKKQYEDAVKPYGYTVRWQEDWDLYHRELGEVHCGTNSLRTIPQTKWWETGR